ncbi:hypothetical protein CU254_25490 [Amycolatopsis sp. AA4]|uniref:hypothetical protein n=1 Tax=Actinomycetes TaxID=1760 RepID=UPI0001B53AD9|nr:MULTISPECIES: hypothetical protein [Actinomycetes]ATY13413.1 hypothetical protein CU254_25490 [Amycolatopsis sp. AA4]
MPGEIRRSKHVTALGAVSLGYLGSAVPEVGYAFGSVKVPWSQVCFVRERGNRIEIGLESRSILWEFDHLELLAALSRRYRARAGENERRLTAAVEASRSGDRASAQSGGKGFDKSFLVFALAPLSIPLTLWDMATF